MSQLTLTPIEEAAEVLLESSSVSEVSVVPETDGSDEVAGTESEEDEDVRFDETVVQEESNSAPASKMGIKLVLFIGDSF